MVLPFARMAHRLFCLGIGAMLIALNTIGTAQQLPSKRMLTLEAAKRMAVAAEAEAAKNNWLIAVAVVDDGGNLLLFHRMDDAKLVAVDIAMRKAKTAVFFQGETKALEEEVTKGGRTALLPIDGFMPLQGGFPIVVDGKVIGGIGVSGMSGEQDAQCASAGLRTLVK
jgi:glc operon protein GlcG